LQEIENLRDEPGPVPEFEGCRGRGQKIEESLQPARILRETPRQLEEEWPLFLLEDPACRDEMSHILLDILEALDMGYDLRGLEAEDEAVCHLARPREKQVLSRHTVEGIVYLNRIEVLRVEGEHFFGRDALRVEPSLPFFVAIAAGAHANLHHSSIMRA